jgi:hypothetical protein
MKNTIINVVKKKRKKILKMKQHVLTRTVAVSMVASSVLGFGMMAGAQTKTPKKASTLSTTIKLPINFADANLTRFKENNVTKQQTVTFNLKNATYTFSKNKKLVGNMKTGYGFFSNGLANQGYGKIKKASEIMIIKNNKMHYYRGITNIENGYTNTSEEIAYTWNGKRHLVTIPGNKNQPVFVYLAK